MKCRYAGGAISFWQAGFSAILPILLVPDSIFLVPDSSYLVTENNHISVGPNTTPVLTDTGNAQLVYIFSSDFCDCTAELLPCVDCVGVCPPLVSKNRFLPKIIKRLNAKFSTNVLICHFSKKKVFSFPQI